MSALLTASLLLAPAVRAADAKPAKVAEKAVDVAKEKTETIKTKRDWYPFYGYVASVDKQAKTVSLKRKDGERVLKLDAKSEVEVNGKEGTLADVKPGYYAHGKLHKDALTHEVITAAKFDKDAPKRDKELDKASDDKGKLEKVAPKVK